MVSKFPYNSSILIVHASGSLAALIWRPCLVICDITVMRVYVPRFFVLSQQRFGVTDIKAPRRVTALRSWIDRVIALRSRMDSVIALFFFNFF